MAHYNIRASDNINLTSRRGTINLNSNTIVSGDLSVNKLTYSSLEPAITLHKSDYDYYVSNSVGSDTDGTGSINNPYKTIQKAINEANPASTIHLANGTYTENLTITKKLYIIGSNNTRYVNTMCSIQGSVTVNLTSSVVDLFNSHVGLIGVQIVGAVEDVSTQQHVLLLKDCYIYTNNGRALYQNSSVDNRTYLENLIVSQDGSTSTDPLIEIKSGMTDIINCHFTCKSNAHVLLLSGNSRTNKIYMNTLESSNSSASLKSIVNITTSQFNSVKTFNYCNFVYGSATAKSSASPNYSCGVLITGYVGSLSYVSITNCNFALAGMTSGYCVQNTNLHSSVVLYRNNTTSSSKALRSASDICGFEGITKYKLSDAGDEEKNKKYTLTTSNITTDDHFYLNTNEMKNIKIKVVFNGQHKGRVELEATYYRVLGNPTLVVGSDNMVVYGDSALSGLVQFVVDNTNAKVDVQLNALVSGSCDVKVVAECITV